MIEEAPEVGSPWTTAVAWKGDYLAVGVSDGRVKIYNILEATRGICSFPLVYFFDSKLDTTRTSTGDLKINASQTVIESDMLNIISLSWIPSAVNKYILVAAKTRGVVVCGEVENGVLHQTTNNDASYHDMVTGVSVINAHYGILFAHTRFKLNECPKQGWCCTCCGWSFLQRVLSHKAGKQRISLVSVIF